MGSCGDRNRSGRCRYPLAVPRPGYDRPVRRTLTALIAVLLVLGVAGLSIASAGAGRAAPAPRGPAAPPPSAPPPRRGPPPRPAGPPPPSGGVLAEMTRPLGTPSRVRRDARRRARAYEHARALAAARARARAAAVRRAAAAAAARRAAATSTTGASSPGYWSDPRASAVTRSNPTSPAESAWLQGGRGGWVEASGFARAPANAPQAIKNVIQAGNQIAHAPYIWGGGHGAWQDKGYDCSGSVSYALAYGGMLGYTETSGQLMNWGAPGPGKWLTIYANEGHVFMYVAGLRFDTSGRAGDHSSRWQLAPRSADGFVARHYPGL